MPFEIPPHIRLVGETELVRYPLYRHFGGLEQYLYFKNGEVIDNLLGGISRHATADTRQVFGGDTELTGIETDFPLGDTVLVHQCDEVLEYFILPTSPFYFLLVEIAIALIINIQHERLEMILCYLASETVLTVVIDSGCCMDKSFDCPGIFFGKDITRFFLDKPEEDRFEP